MSRRPSRRQAGAPTIADVARLAGVSAMTVSRVINAEGNVRPATRDGVNAAIATLSYAPNPAARSLAGARPLRIALLYSNPSAGFLSEYLVGSLDQAARMDVQLIVEKCEFGNHETEVTRHLLERGIDGIVLPPPLCESPALLDLLGAARVPAVAVATANPRDDGMAVTIDDRAAARTMTDHLVALGHARIGFVTGGKTLTASALRLAGYRDALDAAGLAFDDALVAQGDFTYRAGLDAADELLELGDPPTAIFASNDDMAAAAIAVAHRRALDVPGDLTVCGFDDTVLATTVWPALTTIRQPIADMSRTAFETLVTAIRGKDSGPTVRHRMCEFTLIRRQSDAAPRRRRRQRA